MIIQQFYDKGLAHSSYAIVSDNEMVLIDPARDPKPYIDFAQQHQAKIKGVIETHPHADFVSSHLEIHQKLGSIIYVSKLLGANYPHVTFDDHDEIILGKLKLKAMNTPGHSPDSICVLLYDENHRAYALFTGDTLFVGDVGRPDLRENAGNLTSKKEELARAMYHSIYDRIIKLPEDLLVYPAHGPGSLCGKNLSPQLYSTIGDELKSNWALKPMDEATFVKLLIQDQPFVPKYFEYNVIINKAGAPAYEESLAAIPRITQDFNLQKEIPIIDTRPEQQFKMGHLDEAINLQDGPKFETWLGSIINPQELFYLTTMSEEALHAIIQKIAKIGYEGQIKGAFVTKDNGPNQSSLFNEQEFLESMEKFTIIDIRNTLEVKSGKMFQTALQIPLPELRERIAEIPRDKPIVVHCAGGYRSPAGASIIAQYIKEVPVLDMGQAITHFTVKL